MHYFLKSPVASQEHAALSFAEDKNSLFFELPLSQYFNIESLSKTSYRVHFICTHTRVTEARSLIASLHNAAHRYCLRIREKDEKVEEVMRGRETKTSHPLVRFSNAYNACGCNKPDSGAGYSVLEQRPTTASVESQPVTWT